jgi:hypothetical protein
VRVVGDSCFLIPSNRNAGLAPRLTYLVPLFVMLYLYSDVGRHDTRPYGTHDMERILSIPRSTIRPDNPSMPAKPPS